MALAARSTIRRMASISMRALAMTSVFLPSRASGLPKASRLRPRSHHQLEGPLGRADRAHAVVDAAGPEADLGDLEAAALARAACSSLGTRTSVNRRCMWPCGASSSPKTCIGPRISTPGVSIGTRICDCCRCGGGVGAGLHHGDHDLAAGVAGAGDVVLLAVDHPLVAVEHGLACGCSWRPTRRRRARSWRTPSGSRRRSSGSSHCFFCSGVPTRSSTSMLPVSGARAVEALRRQAGSCRARRRCRRSRGWRGPRPVSASGRKKFHSPLALALALAASSSSSWPSPQPQWSARPSPSR